MKDAEQDVLEGGGSTEARVCAETERFTRGSDHMAPSQRFLPERVGPDGCQEKTSSRLVGEGCSRDPGSLC